MRKITIAVALFLLLVTMNVGLCAQGPLKIIPVNGNDSITAPQSPLISLGEAAARNEDNSSSPEHVVQSETADNGNFLSNAVSSGITIFLRSLCDGIHADIYAEGNGTEFTNGTKDGIYNALTFVPDPYEDENIVELYGGYLNFTIFLAAVFVVGALISRSIARMKMDRNKNINLTQAAFIGGIATCGLALVANILFAGVLDTIEVLNQYIAMPAMPALNPDPDSLLLYIIQSICDLILFVFFVIRYYIIRITAVGCSVILVLLVPEFTRDFAKNCLEKIARILFLQPAALFVYVVCIISAPGLPDDLKAFAYIGTTVMVFATCWYFLFGNFTLLKQGINFAIKKGVVKV